MNRTGRYAPSPTGPLHLGNLRTALVAWLLARSQGADFLLRVEDLDAARSKPELIESQLADLRSLGIEWDEMADPDLGGAPMCQGKRTAIYAEAVNELERAGLIYECFCTRTEIRQAASAPHGDLPEGAYPGTCRELSAAELAERRSSDRPAALRVRAEGARIEFSDRLFGESAGLVDDVVVRRNDGTHGYNLAVVVDDAAQRVGEVVRGHDLLDSTPRQIWLAERLGLPAIESWTHVPLVLGSDGERLAKRHGAVTLADRAGAGETLAATRGLLAASLGLCERGESPSPGELIERFEPGSIPLADWRLEEPVV